MERKRMKTLSKMWYAVCLAIVSLVCLSITGLLGCAKEKEQKGQPYRVTGACEIYDKLPKDIEKHVDVNYGGKVRLLGITANKVSPNKLKISYFWQILDDPGAYNVVFVHVTDKDNKPLLQNDHDFCGKRSFKELKGKFIKEPYVVDILPSAMGKDAYIKIGIYAPDLEGTPRLKIESSGGLPTDDGKTRAISEELKL
jgi:hypothetical protein